MGKQKAGGAYSGTMGINFTDKDTNGFSRYIQKLKST